jgi:predicted nucleic acid-binding Zn ribbon protein
MSDIENKLSTHEAVCAERYTGINARLKRLEQILLASAGAIILLLLSVALKIR